ncbi:hypothetical protein Tco_1314517 [Tanacetum coccineum]
MVYVVNGILANGMDMVLEKDFAGFALQDEIQPLNLCYDYNSYGFDQPSLPIDQSPPQEISIQDMEDLKQQYLDDMRSIINQLQINDYRNEIIDIRYRRECEIKIDELRENSME